MQRYNKKCTFARKSRESLLSSAIFLQMGCIMRPYFRGGARFLREVSSKGQLCRLMRGRSPQISRKSREKFTFKQNLLATLHILVGMVEISRAERVGAKFPAYPCSSVLIRGRFYLLAAEQCSYLTSFERTILKN